MKKLAALLALAGLALVLVLGINLARLPAARPALAGAPAATGFDEAAALARLSGAIRIPTISHEDPARWDERPFAELVAYLETHFPRVHRQLRRDRINDYSLLFHWAGSDPRAEPWLLLAHLDVVPVAPGTEGQWQHPPYSGALADGHVWGRGTLDDKSSALAWLEAVESLLAEGYAPPRSLYFAFGHDEEIGGQRGAQAIAAYLAALGVKAAWVLDEGGAITQGLVAGIERPVASIMTGEKGYVSYRLRTEAAGGHSSMPPPQTAVTQLAQALVRLQDHPLPPRLTPPVIAMLERLAPEMPWSQRLAIANRWLFEPLLLEALAETAVSRALTRTTIAPTMLAAGIKDNVLPPSAEAVVNFRLLPGDRIEDLEAHLHAVIADEGVAIERLPTFSAEASPVSATDTPGFVRVERSVAAIFPGALVSTGLVVGGTDARHYSAVARDRYNFTPVLLRPEDLPRIHGSNERIAQSAYVDMVRFYRHLLREQP